MKLIICEKPSVSHAVAPVVGATDKKNGYAEGNGYLVSWCFGHLVGLKFPDDYCEKWAEKWSFSQLPMIPDTWKFRISENGRGQYDILKNLMNDKRVDEIICATDADREGECIFRYVYNLIGCQKPVRRLWVSSLEESAIRNALRNMKDLSEYNNLFQAGFCRAKADWLVGMNGSRLFSCRYRDKLNLGRVQTPTLAMIVKRDYDTEHFVKQRFFMVELNINGVTVSSDRIDSESMADSLVSACNGGNAVISEVKKEIKTANPPKLYDLTTLQRDANKAFGYTAQQTLDFIQSLYEGKLATYPRTDSQYLSDDMKQTALNVVTAIGEVFDFGSVANPDISRCVNNSKVTGHHAIIPTVNIKNADISALPTGEQNILKLIANRLLCASAPVHRYESVKVSVKCGNTDFTTSGKTILENGWKSYVMGKVSESENTLPELKQGQEFPAKAVKSEHFTSPPKPFTEDTLLSAMEHAGQENFDDDTEKKGLGTPATRAATIEGLVKNGYAERKNKQIVSTEKGKNLIAVVPDEVKSAKLTADWENKLKLVENGEYSAENFMNEIQNFIKEICEKYGSVDTSVKFSGSAESIGNCPKCGQPVINGKYGFYCSGKCGMTVAKLYGISLTENQIAGLLNGKQTSYTARGKKYAVLPEFVSNEYNGKTYYQWKTKKLD
ncbi:MAG: DNA topoisomerase 3 [Oscillospiraceae bacterium]